MTSLAALSKVLGGPQVLGRPVDTSLDIVDLVQQGLPSQSVFILQDYLNLNDKVYSKTLGVSDRWLLRYRDKPADHLKVDVSDRLVRVARVFKLAEEVLESKSAAMSWLNRPQIGLSERIPLDLITTEIGAKEVEELLYRIEYSLNA